LGLLIDTSLPAGFADFIMNFPPGLVAGMMLGWKYLVCDQ
jgi:hypothetical protein